MAKPPLDNDPRDVHEATPQSIEGVDGIWRPEEWRGKYLVTRMVLIQGAETEDASRQQPAIAKREVDSTSKFSAFANIYETLDSAEDRCEVLNKEAENAS